MLAGGAASASSLPATSHDAPRTADAAARGAPARWRAVGTDCARDAALLPGLFLHPAWVIVRDARADLRA